MTSFQYLSDPEGNHTAIVIPIDEWNNLTNTYEVLKTIEMPKKEDKKNRNISKFFGILTSSEADKFDKHIYQQRNEWDRNI